MKKLYNLFLLIASFVLLLTACQQEEPYSPGEEDMAGCYGVYFPVQDGGAVLDPAAPTVATIKVARTNSTGAITVPYETVDPTGGLVAGDIVFEDGQSETAFNIDFSKAEIGTQYKFSFIVEDPQYASRYNSQPTAFDFTVLREKWNALGMCRFTDDLLTTGYNIPGAPHTWEVEIEESDSQEGLYRLKNVFWNSPYEQMGAVVDRSRDRYMILHAEDSRKVYIQNFYISGLDLGSQNVAVGSLASYHINKGEFAKAEAFYGTNRGGIITFPKESLLFGELGYEDGALFTSNNNGATKIVFPGVVEVDYSVKVAMDEYSSKGVTHAAVRLGADVAQAKYAIYNGILNTAQIEKRVNAIADGSEGNVKVMTESGVDEIALEKTDMYTIIAVSFSEEGTPRQYDVQNFSFIAAGDDVPVKASCGLSTTDKYRPVGQGDEKFLEYYVYGEDLTEVKICLFRYADIVNNLGICQEILNLQEPVSAEVLAQINDKGYVSGYENLPPDTDYAVLVSASNGFKKELFADFESTQGKLNIDINDYFGLYKGTYCTEDETGIILANTAFIMVPSDNAEKGNVMFPAFMGFNCTSPVYGTYNDETHKVVIPCGQEMLYIPGDDLHLVVANLHPSFAESITIDVVGDGRIGGVSEGFPALLLFVGDQLAGPYDVMYASNLKLQENKEEGSILKSTIEKKTIDPSSLGTGASEELMKKIEAKKLNAEVAVPFQSTTVADPELKISKRNGMVSIDR